MTLTNEQIFAEAIRRQKERGGGAVTDFIIEVVREGWTPPEPEPVDPDLLAFREWFADLPGSRHPRGILAGGWDISDQAQAYLAGARMAREQERERESNMFTKQKSVEIDAVRLDGVGGRALNIIAKYRGEA